MSLRINWDYDLVREFIEDKGFKLITDNYKNNIQILTIKDSEDYLYDTTMQKLKQNNLPHRFSKNNIYFKHNVDNYIKLNKLKIKYIDRAENHKLKFKCLDEGCGKIFYKTWDNFQRTKVCKYCGIKLRFVSRKVTIETMKNKISELGFSLQDDYVEDAHSKITLIDKDGYKYSTIWNNIQQNELPMKFYSSNPYTIFNIKLWLEINKIPIELLSEKYVANDKNLKWKCLKEGCGEVFKTTWQNIYIPTGCPFCAGKRVGKSNCLATKKPELAKEWHPTKNGDLTPSDVTCGTSKRVWWLCNKGHEWNVGVGSRVNTGCPKCKRSRAEEEIHKILTEKNIRFIQEYRSKECMYRKTLPFDFYLPDHNILIEANGKQHYESIEFYGGEKMFELRKKRDKIKREYAKKNNIKLLEIPYWDFDKIEEILKKELNIKAKNVS